MLYFTSILIMPSTIRENKWYNINGGEYKCLSIVNDVGTFIQFEGMIITYKIRKFSLLEIIHRYKDDFEIKDDILPIYIYKEISCNDDLHLVWSECPQEENYNKIEDYFDPRP